MSRREIFYLDYSSSIFVCIFIQLTSEEMVAEFSLARDWRESEIRAFAWHQHAAKCAVAWKDNTIKIFTSGRSVDKNFYPQGGPQLEKMAHAAKFSVSWGYKCAKRTARVRRARSLLARVQGRFNPFRPQNIYSQEEINLYCIIKLATEISLFSLQISKSWCFV